MRRNWYRPGFWVWWWDHRAPNGARLIVASAVAIVILFGGYKTASFMTAANGATGSGYVTTVRVVKTILRPELVRRVITVSRVVTVHEKGRVIRKLVPLVKKVIAPGTTE